MAKGFEQKEGLDFQKTFVSIIEWNTIIFVVALTAHILGGEFHKWMWK